MKKKQDLTITGGGLAGLTLALQVRQQAPDASITVLEKRRSPAPEAAHKVGESSVEIGANYFEQIEGVRDHILNDQLPKLGLRFFFPAGDNSRIEERLELGSTLFAECPSYQIDRGRFENFLTDLCHQRNINFVDGADVRDVEIGGWLRPHTVTYTVDKQPHTIATRWVVDASGRRALLKRKLGLQKDSPHTANAAWFRFSKRISIDDWSTHPHWTDGYQGEAARWYSTNHLMGKGYWVWLIPLASGGTSVGIVAAEEFHPLSSFNSMEKAIAWLEKHEPQCARVVKDNLEHQQDFRAIKHYATECKQVFSANRWGITGEAGFFHDPFYSPGSDFIGMANSFLTDLITRDLRGRGFRIRSMIHNKAFKNLYYGTMTIYQDQYQLFGDPTVMPVKIMWDYLIYWSLSAYIFIQGQMCHQTTFLRNLPVIKRIAHVNHFIQDFFRTWSQHCKANDVNGSINISAVPLIREYNARLAAGFSNREFRQGFEESARQLETLAHEIVAASGLNVDVPFPRHKEGVVHNAFDSVFNPQPREMPLSEAEATSP